MHNELGTASGPSVLVTRKRASVKSGKSWVTRCLFLLHVTPLSSVGMALEIHSHNSQSDWQLIFPITQCSVSMSMKCFLSWTEVLELTFSLMFSQCVYNGFTSIKIKRKEIIYFYIVVFYHSNK